jgi:hypothetical protein
LTAYTSGRLTISILSDPENEGQLAVFSDHNRSEERMAGLTDTETAKDVAFFK